MAPRENLKLAGPVDEAKRDKLKAKINAKVSKKLNRDTELSLLPQSYVNFFSSIGSVIFIPLIIVAAVMAGIKAGFVETLRVGLKLSRWGK
jgi:hypothetical protein